MKYRDVICQPIYGTDNFEVVVQSSWRTIHGPRRIALCTHEDEAEAITLAMNHAIKEGIIS